MKNFALTDFYNRKLIQTEDGSHTFFLPDLNEHYHSVHGALPESLHVFIREGLDLLLQTKKAELNILEVGLGSGLNALLTLLRSTEAGCGISYLALEPYPLTPGEAEALNFAELMGEKMPVEAFNRMHDLPFSQKETILPGFVFEKWPHKVHDAPLPSEAFDLVYFDAFGPQVQPELWTETVFSRVFAAMKKGSLLTTYSAKGSVKRALKSSGFRLEHPAGPKGKREMTRAFKM